MLNDAALFVASSDSPRTTRHTLNRLIIACREDILAERDAERATRDPAGRDRLHEQTQQRHAFIHDLGAVVHRLGGAVAQQAGTLAWLRSLARQVRALVAGWNEGDGYRACAEAEQRTVRTYAAALSTLPPDARFGVKQQLAQVEEDLEEARHLRALH
jgi:uncharacterized protein (TIGR02284 family)